MQDEPEVVLVCMRVDDLQPVESFGAMEEIAREVRGRSLNANCEICHNEVIYDPVLAPHPLPAVWCARCAFEKAGGGETAH